MVNPLHHIPIVGPLYRELSGDTISLGSRLIGGTVVGGGLGFVGALGQHIFERYDGTEKLKSMVGLAPNQREKTAMQASGNGKQQTDQNFATLASSGNTIATQGVASPPGDTKGTELENNAVPATHNETILEGALALSAFLAQNHTKQKVPRLPEEKIPPKQMTIPQQPAKRPTTTPKPFTDMIGKHHSRPKHHLWDTCPQSHKSNYRHRHNQDGSYPTIKPDAKYRYKSNEAYQKLHIHNSLPWRQSSCCIFTFGGKRQSNPLPQNLPPNFPACPDNPNFTAPSHPTHCTKAHVTACRKIPLI